MGMFGKLLGGLGGKALAKGVGGAARAVMPSQAEGQSEVQPMAGKQGIGGMMAMLKQQSATGAQQPNPKLGGLGNVVAALKNRAATMKPPPPQGVIAKQKPTLSAGMAAMGQRAPMMGYSPELMEEQVQQQGGILPAMGAIQAARYKEQGADPRLLAMTPENRAALDRYTNFAQMRRQGGGPLDYMGGMINMAATEGLKAIPGADRAASAVWNRVTGNPGGASFFGGADQSKPSLANLAAAHYGYTRGGRM
jgi:hypothetical protein